MRPITIIYDDLQSGEKKESVSSFSSLVDRVRTIGQEYSARVKMPFGLDLLAENGDRLSIALGSDHAVISRFSAEHEDTITAVGDPDATGSTTFYFGDHSLMPNKFVISSEVAWKIIQEWCESGTLSCAASWTSQII